MLLTWLSYRTEYIYKLKVLALKKGALGEGKIPVTHVE